MVHLARKYNLRRDSTARIYARSAANVAKALLKEKKNIKFSNYLFIFKYRINIYIFMYFYI